MKRLLLILAIVALVSGCGDPARPKKITDSADELAKLPVATQVALVLDIPLLVLAVGVAINGLRLFTCNRIVQKVAPEAKK